jgi:aspartate/methionine/tyrosine aminotransferase
VTRPIGAVRLERFTESVIREMTRLADLHGAVNLAQGFPDFDAPEVVKEAAREAIARGVNQYPVTWGAPGFRAAIAEKYRRFGWPEIDPDREITVTCGSTEAMVATFLSLLDPGDEVVFFEPFYENYGPDAYLAGAVPKVVPLAEPGWRFDPERTEAAVGPRTRAIVMTTPHNPAGRVFDQDELEALAEIAIRHDLLVFTDEIYEHIVYDGREHRSVALLPGMRERTVTISALSKTYSVTGWRVGWSITSAEIALSLRKVHDFLTVAAPAPLQEAGITALSLPDEFYRDLAAFYAERRDRFFKLAGEAFAEQGVELLEPEGAYYALARIGPWRERLGLADDTAFCQDMITRAGVAAVPGSSFFVDPRKGFDLVRFAFCKRLETIDEAVGRLGEYARSASRT